MREVCFDKISKFAVITECNGTIYPQEDCRLVIADRRI